MSFDASLSCCLFRLLSFLPQFFFFNVQFHQIFYTGHREIVPHFLTPSKQCNTEQSKINLNKQRGRERKKKKKREPPWNSRTSPHFPFIKIASATYIYPIVRSSFHHTTILPPYLISFLPFSSSLSFFSFPFDFLKAFFHFQPHLCPTHPL